jgi:uncharacterized 2Fe-2S/4Fe-4S cluster protein (DUF4445 family)
MTSSYSIAFEPMNIAVDCGENETLLDCARRHRIRLATSCGGQGTCASCLIQFTEGSPPQAIKAEKDIISPARLAQGWRRACLVRPIGDSTVFVPPRSTAAPVRTHVEGNAADIDIDPPVKTVSFELSPPNMEDTVADDKRLHDALKERDEECTGFDPALLRSLSRDLRGWDWRGWVATFKGQVIAAGSVDQRPLGLAVDLGTTNISGILVDLKTGSTLAEKGMENPQTSLGADLITYASVIRRKPEAAEQLRHLSVTALNQLAADLCLECQEKPERIVEATIAGNTMMHHLLLGLPVHQLAMSPFVPALSRASDIKARDLGLEFAPGGNVHLLPNIAGFVGGDHIATLLAAILPSDKPAIIMDIGTNTEISLVDGEHVTSVSCPSGPAFEGGHLSHGMRAAEGAIELVRIKGDEVHFETIGDGVPVGICGSGVLDAVAQLQATGICNERGQIQDGQCRVQGDPDKREFVLATKEEAGGNEITLTQDDIRAVQLAKGAIRAATDQLLEKTGFAEKDLGQVIIAGAFGNYIDVGSALAIGMLPDLPYRKFAQIGNAAGEGARQVLLSNKIRAEARDLARRADYFELAGAKSFMKTFGARINFPEKPLRKSSE